MTDEIDLNLNHTGSTFDSFLEEEGILEEVSATAMQRVTDWLKIQSDNTTEK
jgi:hypothetical protein